MSYIFSKIYQILGFDKKIKLHRFIYYINLSFINCLTVQRNRGEWRDNWPTKFDTANPPQLIPNPCATQDSSDLWLLRVGRVGHAPTPFESETHPTCVCVCVYTGGKEIQEIHRKEIRIASHKFSSQRQPRFLVLIFKARAAIYYSTTVRICIFSPRILEPPLFGSIRSAAYPNIIWTPVIYRHDSRSTNTFILHGDERERFAWTMDICGRKGEKLLFRE